MDKRNESSIEAVIEHLQVLRNLKNGAHRWIIVEEPFGRGRTAISELIDFVVCIDIPLEIAFARTIRRAALTAPENVGVPTLLENLIKFVDEYLSVGRDTYKVVNKNVMRECDLVVDGTNDVDFLVNEIVGVLQPMGRG